MYPCGRGFDPQIPMRPSGHADLLVLVQLPLPCWAAFFGETPFPASCFILLSALAIVEDLPVVGSTTSIISCAHNATAGVDHVPSSRTVMLHLFPEDLGTPPVCILSLFHLS